MHGYASLPCQPGACACMTKPPPTSDPAKQQTATSNQQPATRNQPSAAAKQAAITRLKAQITGGAILPSSALLPRPNPRFTANPWPMGDVATNHMQIALHTYAYSFMALTTIIPSTVFRYHHTLLSRPLSCCHGPDSCRAPPPLPSFFHTASPQTM